VIKDGKILSEIFEDRMRGQAERLLPMCQEACAAAEISFGDLSAVAVTRGPGTFTGVRIGLAAAKGLALALNISLVGMTTLEVLARSLAENGATGRVAIVLDARRSEVYLQSFDFKNGLNMPIGEPAAVPLEDVRAHLDPAVTALFGTGVNLVKPLLSQDMLKRLDFPGLSPQLNAGTMAVMVYEKMVAGETGGNVTPLYLRPPDAVAAKPVTYPFQNQ
jgi:tRNA threonylcarbamoyladenosine biosynthesis protein TsaB